MDYLNICFIYIFLIIFLVEIDKNIPVTIFFTIGGLAVIVFLCLCVNMTMQLSLKFIDYGQLVGLLLFIVNIFNNYIYFKRIML